jgi:hypothetical protein
MHTLPPVDVAQSAAAVQSQVCEIVLQFCPERLAAQSALVAHPTHMPVVVLQVGLGLAAQSALVAHPTHRPVVVLHAGETGLSLQSALLAQALLHWLPPHTWPLAQSVIAVQPQTASGTGMPGGCIMRMPHCVPPAAWAQSAMAEHPHVCVVVSHTGPSGFVAQSALALQPFSQRAFLHTDPVGHSLVAVQPHLFSGMPATTTTGPKHAMPEADDAQSESKLHTQSCVRVLQRGPWALVAQSALVLQPVVASTPASPGGNVPASPGGNVVWELLHPHRASVEMIPATSLRNRMMIILSVYRREALSVEKRTRLDRRSRPRRRTQSELLRERARASAVAVRPHRLGRSEVASRPHIFGTFW